MLSELSFGTLRFGEPLYLWPLSVPLLFLIIWLWRVSRRKQEIRLFRQQRKLPVRERFAPVGGLAFWLCLILATSFVLLALAKPQAMVSSVRKAGVDVIILQDGSASMSVQDAKPDRWQRSMKFLRVLAETLEWKNDRIAMAVFAHIAAPQVRLTTDPNTFLFFLDHLEHQSPFPLQDDTTWDTNIEQGIYWGTRLIDKDEQLYGRSPNGKIFVLLSDGQAWSGKVDRSLRTAQSLDIPVFVVGVGTASGGFIPEATSPSVEGIKTIALSPIRAGLDRVSLLHVATAGGGQYYDLDSASDRQIATNIIDAARRRVGARDVQQSFQDLYWYCLLASACFLCLGVLFLREAEELWLEISGVAATLVILWAVMH